MNIRSTTRLTWPAPVNFHLEVGDNEVDPSDIPAAICPKLSHLNASGVISGFDVAISPPGRETLADVGVGQ